MIAGWKNSGKNWGEFVTDLGTDVLRQLVTAIRQAVPDRELTIRLYSSDPSNGVYSSIDIRPRFFHVFGINSKTKRIMEVNERLVSSNTNSKGTQVHAREKPQLF